MWRQVSCALLLALAGPAQVPMATFSPEVPTACSLPWLCNCAQVHSVTGKQTLIKTYSGPGGGSNMTRWWGRVCMRLACVRLCVAAYDACPHMHARAAGKFQHQCMR